MQQTSPAMHVYSKTGCLFITDRLVNNSSWSTWVLPSVFNPSDSFHDGGNGSTTTSVQLMAIPSKPTDGCPSANLGLPWDFMWRSVVADVTYPLVGVHFLSFRPLDVLLKPPTGRGHFVFCAGPSRQIADPQHQTIIGCKPFDSLIAEFPYLIRSAGVQHEVRHNPPSHPDSTRPTSQLLTTATGTRPARNRQS